MRQLIDDLLSHSMAARPADLTDAVLAEAAAWAAARLRKASSAASSAGDK